jgi:Thioesterase superfamily
VTGSSPPLTSHLDGIIRDGRHHMQVRVFYEDTDFSGIVYHANYLRFMERGRTNHLRLMGAEQHALFAEARAETPGFAFVVRSMHLDYLKPARMDDHAGAGGAARPRPPGQGRGARRLHQRGPRAADPESAADVTEGGCAGLISFSN